MGIVGVFLLKSLPSEPLTSTAIFPNPFLLLAEITSLLLISWFKGERNGLELKTFAFSFFPPLFFILLSRRWIREQKNAGNPWELYAGVYLLMLISGFFLLLTGTIIAIALVFSSSPSGILVRLGFILLLGPVSLCGWWLGSYVRKEPPTKTAISRIMIGIISYWLIIFILPLNLRPIYI